MSTSPLDNIYVSLDEARASLEKRRMDPALLKRIESLVSANFMPEFKAGPRGVLWKYILSPDNGFSFFLNQCAYVKVEPLVLEYLGDMFITINEEKKGLGRLRLTLPDGSREVVDIMDFPPNQRRRMDEVVLKNGETLADLHHRLLKISGYQTGLRDQTDWAHTIGRPADYYYPYLAHFIAHGVLFESYLTDDPDEREVAFTREVVAPVMDRLEKEFGLRPLIVRLFPEQQSESEDFYWWSYPPHVNEYLLSYVDEHGLRQRRKV